MGNKLGKILTGLGCLIGALGAGFGILAAVAPNLVFQYAMPLSKSLNTPSASNWMSNSLPVIIIGFVAIVMLLAFSPLLMGYLNKRKKISRLKMVGVKGTGKIMSVQDTGITVNNSPYVKIILEIEQTHTRAEITALVGRVSFPRAGDTLDVVYDPSDPTIAMPASEMN